MKTRRDADRPPVRCPECRSFRPGERLCPVARKLFVLNKATTCMKFSPKIGAPATKRPATADKRHAPAPPWTLPELRAVLELEDLADAVAELVVDAAGSVRIRFALDADIESMNATGRLIAFGTLDAGREGSR